jgi:hypothetical protein
MAEETSSLDILSVEDVRQWLKQEIEDSNKARELRIKQATQLVEDYSHSKVTPEAAMEKLYEYDMRWGDALFGTHANEHNSDEDILKSIDTARETSAIRRTRAATRRGAMLGPE